MSEDLQLERYEVVRKLGEGGMAEVYEVRHRQLGSRHALKLFRRGSRELAARLQQEGEVQARLSHPNVVAVTDAVSVGARSALVLEFVDGLPLDAWLEAHPAATDAVRRDLACQILAGVRHAHERDTIHRDLKPANVLVGGPDDAPLAKVADFGLAKWVEAPSRTRSGIPMGTPRYMAPEQLRDAKSVDERADVFSLGCLLAELWSGVPVFEQGGLLTQFERVSGEEYVLPHDLPRDVSELVRACLQPDPDRRPQSVEALQQRLGCHARAPVAAAPRLPWVAAGLGSGVALTGGLGAVLVLVLLALGCAGLLWSSSLPVVEPSRPILSPAPAPTPPAPRDPPTKPAPGETPRAGPLPDREREPPPDDDAQPEPDKERDKEAKERDKEAKERDKEDKGKGKGKKKR